LLLACVLLLPAFPKGEAWRVNTRRSPGTPGRTGLRGFISRAPLVKELRFLQRQLLSSGNGEEELLPLTSTLLDIWRGGKI